MEAHAAAFDALSPEGWDDLAEDEQRKWDTIAMSLYPGLRDTYVMVSMERDELKGRLRDLGDTLADSEDQRENLHALVIEMLDVLDRTGLINAERLAEWAQRAAAGRESDPLS